MECIIHPALDATFFQHQVDRVGQRLALDDIPVRPIIIPGKEGCEIVARQAGVEPEAVAKVCGGGHSASVSAGDKEYVVVLAGKPFLREDAKAARGLIAHELMHTLQRESGLEQVIEDAGVDAIEGVVDRMAGLGFSEDESEQFIRSVVATAVLSCKDIYANTALIRSGLGEELARYYYYTLEEDSFCPMPMGYEDEQHLDDVLDRITFELGILPAWLPFDRLDREKGDMLQERAEECYETSIPATTACIEKIKEVYHAVFSDGGRFRERFFDTVIDCSIRIIEDKVVEG